MVTPLFVKPTDMSKLGSEAKIAESNLLNINAVTDIKSCDNFLKEWQQYIFVNYDLEKTTTNEFLCSKDSDCLNGGVCFRGMCDCTDVEKYTGSFCDMHRSLYNHNIIRLIRKCYEIKLRVPYFDHNNVDMYKLTLDVNDFLTIFYFLSMVMIRPEILTIEQLEEIEYILNRLTLESHFKTMNYSELGSDNMHFVINTFDRILNFTKMKLIETNSLYSYWDAKDRYFKINKVNKKSAHTDPGKTLLRDRVLTTDNLQSMDFKTFLQEKKIKVNKLSNVRQKIIDNYLEVLKHRSMYDFKSKEIQYVSETLKIEQKFLTYSDFDNNSLKLNFKIPEIAEKGIYIPQQFLEPEFTITGNTKLELIVRVTLMKNLCTDPQIDANCQSTSDK